jgi:Fe-S cluster assembly protein SufD
MAAAAVSSLDKDQLFYLRSRGVPLAEAKRMLVEGFFTEAFLALREDSLRERVRRELDEKLKEVS